MKEGFWASIAGNDCQMKSCIMVKICQSMSTRKEVSMEPPQYNGGLLVLQKREYLAKRNTWKRLRITCDFIFRQQLFEPSKRQVFWLKPQPSRPPPFPSETAFQCAKKVSDVRKIISRSAADNTKERLNPSFLLQGWNSPLWKGEAREIFGRTCLFHYGLFRKLFLLNTI